VKQSELNTWLTVGSLGVGLVALWWMMNNQSAAPATGLNTTTATLPTLSNGTVSTPTALVTPSLTSGALPGGVQLPGFTTSPNLSLNIPLPQIPNLNDPSTWNIYGESNSTPPWVMINVDQPATGASADGGTTGGSCGCGCSSGGGSSGYLGTTISNILSRDQEDALAATWSNGIPNLAGVSFLTPQPLYTPPVTAATAPVPVGVPGYNGGNAI
jgi:hypothetical protein